MLLLAHTNIFNIISITGSTLIFTVNSLTYLRSLQHKNLSLSNLCNGLGAGCLKLMKLKATLQCS